MTVSRPPQVTVGDEVRLAGDHFRVAAVLAGEVVLVDVTGAESALRSAVLFADPTFELVSPAGCRAPLPPQGLLGNVDEAAVARALWWERHVIEVLTGTPPEAGPAAAPRPGYDPALFTLRQRELAKVAELAEAGEAVVLSTVQQKRHSYQNRGLWGLIDGRLTRAVDGDVDERVLAAVRAAVEEQTDRSTGTVSRLRRRVEQILAEGGVDPVGVMPSRSTFYRLVERVAAGRHTFGSAPTRRSLAQQPDGPFGAVAALRPGEWVQVDSTPLDVRVMLDDGSVDRVELTWLIDLATRAIPAAVLRPTTKAVDAALLLARAVTPEQMRPGWAQALAMSRSVLPFQRLLALDERLAHAAARPVIVPETIVIDHGMVYLSQTFRTACRAMGITVQPTHPGSPFEKGAVERSFDSVATLFAQHVAGYVGRSVDRRGKNAERDAVWSMRELQELLDEWIVACWQNRPHDGLRHPLLPGRALTPNEAYAALLETAGYVPVPLGARDYLELLPATWRVINSYGVKIAHRTYDCDALNPYRRQHSGVAASKGLWEVHYDPYDVTTVWVRNHLDGGWITVPWRHLRATPAPFGAQAWDQARQILARRGGDPATEAEIAGAVTALLDKAETGPDTPATTPTKRDRRVAARTRATAEALWPKPAPAAEDTAPAVETAVGTAAQPDAADDDPADQDLEELAAVIPLPTFDAREEAKRWW